MVYTINGEQLTRRKLITIDGSKATTETGIPLGLNINLPNVKATGADVRLAKLDGTPIAREIECVGVPATDDVMIWYPFDTVANTDSQFYVYWGNAALTEPAANSTYGSQAVWDSNYVGVWHMNQDPSGTAPQLKDSTSNGNDGTMAGAMTGSDLIDYGYGKGISFDGVDDRFDISDSSSINADIESTNEISIMSLLTRRTVGDLYDMIFDKSDNGFALRCYEDKLFMRLYIGSSLYMQGTTVQTVNTAYSEFCTWASGDGDLYVDGVSDAISTGTLATATGTIAIDTSALTIADLPAGGYNIHADIGEFRLAKVKWTANYIATTHKNLNNPTATGTTPFYLSMGEPQHQRRHPQFI